jgi:hypothetical protein
MDTVEKAVAALLKEGAPPERDVAFALAVMARIERKQFRRTLLLNVALMIAGAILLALLLPPIERIWPTTLSNFWVGTLLITAAIIISRVNFAED